MSEAGNSNRITRDYLDSLLIETRYMDSGSPALDFDLYGKRFASPVMTAALSHLDHFMFPGAAAALAGGAKEAGAVLWYGMADEEEIERLAAFCPDMIEIIKPYADREVLYRKIRHAEKLDLLAVGVDIDHAFGGDGSPDIVDGQEMKVVSSGEMKEICSSTRLPVIVKGVLSPWDAERCLAAGAKGLVISHHNNRIEYALPPLAALPEIVKLAGDVPVFVDDEIRTGLDAFKALALGAKGVCIGRPLMTAIKEDIQIGVRDYLLRTNAELGKAMAFTACRDLGKMDPSVIHHRCW